MGQFGRHVCAQRIEAGAFDFQIALQRARMQAQHRRDRALVTLRGAERAMQQMTHARRQRLRRVAEVLRSEEHTSELQSLMRISYAVFCLKKNKIPEDTKLRTT